MTRTSISFPLTVMVASQVDAPASNLDTTVDTEEIKVAVDVAWRLAAAPRSNSPLSPFDGRRPTMDVLMAITVSSGIVYVITVV